MRARAWHPRAALLALRDAASRHPLSCWHQQQTHRCTGWGRSVRNTSRRWARHGRPAHGAGGQAGSKKGCTHHHRRIHPGTLQGPPSPSIQQPLRRSHTTGACVAARPPPAHALSSAASRSSTDPTAPAARRTRPHQYAGAAELWLRRHAPALVAIQLGGGDLPERRLLAVPGLRAVGSCVGGQGRHEHVCVASNGR